MYKRIVVGTDGSSSATRAVQHAGELAQLTGASVHVVHAYQPVAPLAGLGLDGGAAAASVGINEAAERNGLDVARRASDQIRRLGVETEVHICAGDAATAICETAEALDADLIVVGSKGMAGVRRLMLGSVPNKVSHHCDIHLLIVQTT